MLKIEKAIQGYLDLCGDPTWFCDGRVIDWSNSSGDVPRGPNCQVRDQCRLFRAMPNSGNARSFCGVGSAEKGCHAFQWWKDYARQQLEDLQAWEVTIGGFTRTVNGRSPDVAACRALVELRREGFTIDKMLLLEGEYTAVRVDTAEA